MGFFSGRVTCMRFRVDGKAPRSFDTDFLESLAVNAIGKQKIAAGDGSQSGWIAGDHILDYVFRPRQERRPPTRCTSPCASMKSRCRRICCVRTTRSNCKL